MTPSFPTRRSCDLIREQDEFRRRVVDDRVVVGGRQQLFGADESGHAPGPRARRAAPQAFDGPETRGRSRLDQHDEAQTPGRKGANFVRLHRPADEAARFWRDGKLSRSEEHTSELQSLMRSSYAVFCLKKKITKNT